MKDEELLIQIDAAYRKMEEYRAANGYPSLAEDHPAAAPFEALMQEYRRLHPLPEGHWYGIQMRGKLCVPQEYRHDGRFAVKVGPK